MKMTLRDEIVIFSFPVMLFICNNEKAYRKLGLFDFRVTRMYRHKTTYRHLDKLHRIMLRRVAHRRTSSSGQFRHRRPLVRVNRSDLDSRRLRAKRSTNILENNVADLIESWILPKKHIRVCNAQMSPSIEITAKYEDETTIIDLVLDFCVYWSLEPAFLCAHITRILMKHAFEQSPQWQVHQ